MDIDRRLAQVETFYAKHFFHLLCRFLLFHESNNVNLNDARGMIGSTDGRPNTKYDLANDNNLWREVRRHHGVGMAISNDIVLNYRANYWDSHHCWRVCGRLSGTMERNRWLKLSGKAQFVLSGKRCVRREQRWMYRWTDYEQRAQKRLSFCLNNTLMRTNQLS